MGRWQQDEEEMRQMQLVPAIALDSLDLAYPIDDGRDKLFESLDVHVLRQALQDLGEVDVGFLYATFTSTLWRTSW